MSTITSTIIVGREHLNHGGLSMISALIFLTENSRPHWRIQALKKGLGLRELELTPTLNNTIDDAFLLLACSLDLVKEPSKEMSDFSDRLKQGRLMMYDIQEDVRHSLYQECQAWSEDFPKTVVTIFAPDSLLFAQTAQMRAYKNSMALLMPRFVRDTSQWNTDPIESGEL